MASQSSASSSSDAGDSTTTAPPHALASSLAGLPVRVATDGAEPTEANGTAQTGTNTNKAQSGQLKDFLDLAVSSEESRRVVVSFGLAKRSARCGKRSKSRELTSSCTLQTTRPAGTADISSVRFTISSLYTPFRLPNPLSAPPVPLSAPRTEASRTREATRDPKACFRRTGQFHLPLHPSPPLRELFSLRPSPLPPASDPCGHFVLSSPESLLTHSTYHTARATDEATRTRTRTRRTRTSRTSRYQHHHHHQQRRRLDHQGQQRSCSISFRKRSRLFQQHD